MKKALLALFIAILALSVCSCTKNTPVTNQTDQPQTTAPVSSTLPEPEIEVTGIELNKSSLQIAEGCYFQLTAKALPENASLMKVAFTSSDPSLAYIDQNGFISAIKEGEVVITASVSSGIKAECKVTISKRADKIDSVHYKMADKLTWLYCYGDGLGIDENNNIVFTPNIYQFEDMMRNGKAKNYEILLRFTHIASEKYPYEYTFTSIKAEHYLTNSDNLSITLKSADFDSGFCPIPGETYNIELSIVNSKNSLVLYYGTYENIVAATNIETSSHYSPTPMPGFISKGEGQYYLSYQASTGGKVQGALLQALAPNDKSLSVKAVANPGYKFAAWSDGVMTAERNDIMTEGDKAITAYFVRGNTQKTGIPNMFIFTNSGFPVTQKEYESASMVIIDAENSEHNMAASMQIKGRGNSSWNPYANQESYDSKNSYRIKLDEKAQLLGIGDSKQRDWVLNSNKFDPSGLRNYLVWQLADKMNTLPYVTDCYWVQLYVNGEYRGMYMINELVEVGHDRVDVDDSINSTDKGYLIEIDFRGTEEAQPYFYIKGYGAASNNNAREFVIKSKCSDEDLAFIKDYVQKCHDAFLKGKRSEIEKYVDIPSLIDMYIIEELSKDVDVGAASFYMQKDPGGKIYFTAPWDFDFGFGTYGDAVSNENMISYDRFGCTWYAKLYEQQWFRDAVLARMTELDAAFEETMKEVKAMADKLEASTEKNCKFWNVYGNKYHSYVSSKASRELNSYDDHINYLINWTNGRWDIMKTILAEK